ncbi:MAG: suppressor of fused domain protein [Verrucomicrobiota bacterium]
MGASPIIRHVYEETIERFGEPDQSYAFYDPPPPPESNWPERIDVLIWFDEQDLAITSFATVGMADKPMVGCDHRAELHFAVRRTASTMDLNKVSAFCANLALYPFMNKTSLDWAHTITQPGSIPYFPSCDALLMYPAFTDEGWDKTTFDSQNIHILNLVPVTFEELAYRSKHGPFSIFDYLAENEVDLFTDRNVGAS